jgi:hypothetical protein
MSTHAKLSPSSSARWIKCAGSINAIESARAAGVIDESSNIYSAEGTIAHYIGEQCLLKGDNPRQYTGETHSDSGFTFTVDDNMTDAVEIYVDYVRGSVQSGSLISDFDDIDADDIDVDDIDVDMQIEVKCSLTLLGIEGLDGGTSDTLLIAKEKKQIEVIDYKHGMGVVQPENNTQMMSYAAGALLALGISELDEPWNVTMTIVQPRAFDPAGPIRSITMTSEELFQWLDDVLIPAALLTQEPDAPLDPSEDGCKYCPVRGNCPALYKMMEVSTMSDFKDIELELPIERKLPEVITLTVAQKQLVMKNGSMIKSFIHAVEKQVKLELENGSQDYDLTHKLVLSKTKRVFTDTAFDKDSSQIFDWLTEDEIYKDEDWSRKTNTLGSIEKSLKNMAGIPLAKEIMDAITTKSEGYAVLAPLSDARTAIMPGVVSDFAELDDQASI